MRPSEDAEGGGKGGRTRLARPPAPALSAHLVGGSVRSACFPSPALSLIRPREWGRLRGSRSRPWLLSRQGSQSASLRARRASEREQEYSQTCWLSPFSLSLCSRYMGRTLSLCIQRRRRRRGGSSKAIEGGKRREGASLHSFNRTAAAAARVSEGGRRRRRDDDSAAQRRERERWAASASAEDGGRWRHNAE